MFIFSEEKRRQLQEERPELSESELTRLLARMWNDLSEKKKVGPWRDPLLLFPKGLLGHFHARGYSHFPAPEVNHTCTVYPGSVAGAGAGRREAFSFVVGSLWRAAPWVGRSLVDVTAAHGFCRTRPQQGAGNECWVGLARPLGVARMLTSLLFL